MPLSNIVASVEDCVDKTIERIGCDLVIAAPLGLGKPVQLLNAFYQRALTDPTVSLHIITALCLEVPKVGSGIEEKLAGPIVQRLFGDYEELAFLAPYRDGDLPSNVKVTEFYFKAGAMKNSPEAQQHYISSNYTHIVRDMIALGLNVMVQMVAARESDNGLTLSLSSNTDLSLDVIDWSRATSRPHMLLAQIHDDMPFMTLDAEVSPTAFHVVVRNKRYNRALFAVPNTAIPLQDYATALHASSLIADGGTLQVGIGSLGDAVAQACILRHQHNQTYCRLLAAQTVQAAAVAVEHGPFEQGLYASTEMFVNGMMQLIEQGIIKRKVYDNLALQQGLNEGRISVRVDYRMLEYGRLSGLIPVSLDASSLQELQYWGIIDQRVALHAQQLSAAGETCENNLDNAQTRTKLLRLTEGSELRNGRFLHGGFFLGPKNFYAKLQQLRPSLQDAICMTGVRRTNQLLLDYPLYCAQRLKARFINTGMIVSLSGAVASDTLEDGTVISGVGGQYNFVAMAQDLPDARSILCIRSTREEGRQLKSNIVPSYGFTTIPKHLRDIVVTEYGIADLRGQSESTIVQRLINIADSRFQDPLLEFAKQHHKLPPDYQIPLSAKNNTPQRLHAILEPFKRDGLLPDYPFGTELTERELALGASLRKIKSLSDEPTQFLASAFKALLHHADPDAAKPFLERIQLEHPETTKEFLVQQLLLLDLQERGFLKAS